MLTRPFLPLTRAPMRSGQVWVRCSIRERDSLGSNSSPKVEDDRLLGHLVPHAVDCELVKLLDARSLDTGNDRYVAVVGVFEFSNDNRLRLLGLSLLRLREYSTSVLPRGTSAWEKTHESELGVDRTHPLASRRRHTRHGRIQAVEMPMLLTEVAGDDAAVLGKGRG